MQYKDALGSVLDALSSADLKKSSSAELNEASPKTVEQTENGKTAPSLEDVLATKGDVVRLSCPSLGLKNFDERSFAGSVVKNIIDAGNLIPMKTSGGDNKASMKRAQDMMKQMDEKMKFDLTKKSGDEEARVVGVEQGKIWHLQILPRRIYYMYCIAMREAIGCWRVPSITFTYHVS